MDEQHRFSSLVEVQAKIEEHQLQTTTHFTTVNQTKNFGRWTIAELSPKFRIHWQDIQPGSTPSIPFEGTPFVICGTKRYECHQGPDRNVTHKAKEKEEEKSDHCSVKKRRFLSQPTKKLDCGATIKVRHVVFFPQFKIDDRDNKKWRRDQYSFSLRGAIKEKPDEVELEHCFMMHLPKEEEHSNHLVGEYAGLSQSLDQALVLRIGELVSRGIIRPWDVKQHLKEMVIRELFPDPATIPPITNRRYWPSDRDIYNYVYRATMSLRQGKLDQENLKKMCDDLKIRYPEDNVYFRPNIDNPPDKKASDVQMDEDVCPDESVAPGMLLVHQTKWQRHLLQLYGGEIVLLDATYKTSRYALPLFFLCVPTNVNYSVVGLFVTHYETSKAIEEALSKIKEWNPNWSPKYFMTDYCEAEMTAVSSLFAETEIYLCDFHREQAWVRWTGTTKSGISAAVRDDVLDLLRNVAKAKDTAMYEASLETLKQSVHWRKNRNLQKWFQTRWLSKVQHWVRAFRNEDFHVRVNTNNGVERMNELLKYSYLAKRRDNTLSMLFHVLTTDFLSDLWLRYVRLNVAAHNMARAYTRDLPEFLHNRPKQMIMTTRQRYADGQRIASSDIEKCDEDGKFKIKSQSSDEWYRLSFGSQTEMPSCECEDWRKLHLPCKHFCAVFYRYEDWGWDAMAPAYRDSPFFSLDLMEGNLPLGTYTPNPTEKEALDTILEDMPTPVIGGIEYGVEGEAKRSRELLEQLKDLTYLMPDLETLQRLSMGLKDLLEEVAPSIPQEDGLPLLKGKPSQKAESSVKGMNKVQGTKPNTRVDHSPKAEPRSEPEGTSMTAVNLVALPRRVKRKRKVSSSKTVKDGQAVLETSVPELEVPVIDAEGTPSRPVVTRNEENAQDPGISAGTGTSVTAVNLVTLPPRVVQKRKRPSSKAMENDGAGIGVSIPNLKVPAVVSEAQSTGPPKKRVRFSGDVKPPRSERPPPILKPDGHDDAVINQEFPVLYVSCKIGSYVVQGMDTNSVIEDKGRLTDAVISAYIEFLKRKCWEKGRRLFHLDWTILTKILDGKLGDPIPYTQRSRMHFDTCQEFVGVWHRNGNHWAMFHADNVTGAITYVDSLGELLGIRACLLHNWKTFIKLRNARCDREGNRKSRIREDWHLNPGVPHDKQPDSNSCGVYALTYARRVLSSESLSDAVIVRKERRHILMDLLTSTDSLGPGICHICGMQKHGLLNEGDEERPSKVCRTPCGRAVHSKCLPATVREHFTVCEVCKPPQGLQCYICSGNVGKRHGVKCIQGCPRIVHAGCSHTTNWSCGVCSVL